MVRLTLVLLFALVGCVDTGTDKDGTSEAGGSSGSDNRVDATDPDGSPDPDDSGDAEHPTGVTWNEHIRPLMGKHCTRCHYDAGLGVGNFEDQTVVSAMAEIMLSRIDSGAMPPPVSNPECREYLGSDHLNMPVEARDTFAEWIDGGKLEGDPADTPEFEPIVEMLVEPDLVALIPEPYTPLFEDEENPGNEYRCFVIDMELEEALYITSMAPVLDQKSMVHHIVLFTKNVDDIPEDEKGPEGYDCIDGGMADGVNGMIAGWAPGAVPVEFPEGFGMRMSPNDRLVLQMHYYQSGPEMVGVADQTGYAFHTAESVDRSVLMFPIGNTSFVIPAGAPAHSDASEIPLTYLPEGLSVDILGAFPHMHVLGSGYRMWIKGEGFGGDQCLVESDAYDFDNQQTYFFENPVTVTGADTIGFECTWDNSADNPNQMFDEPQAIRYGERTNEEMCFAFTLIGL